MTLQATQLEGPALPAYPPPTLPTPALFVAKVTHNRLVAPRRYFEQRVRLAYLDLDRMPDQLDDLPLWSGRRRGWVHYREQDFLDGQPEPLAPRVRQRLADTLGWDPGGPVHMLANLRTGGWLFNPLTLYWAFDPAGELAAILAEVTNTPWRQRTWYAIDARGRTRGHATKQMHVSPFLPMDLEYEFSWRQGHMPDAAGASESVPDRPLAFTVTAHESGVPVFSAGLRGHLVPLSRSNALRAVLTRPFGSAAVSAGIYAHAGVLALRRARFHRHPGPPTTGGPDSTGAAA